MKKQVELGLKLNGVNEQMNKIDKTLTEQANSLEFVHNEVSEKKRNQSSADSSHTELAAIVDSLRLHTAQLEGKLNKQHKQAEYKAMDLEARSRRSNLIFHGLTETTDESCDDVLRKFVKNELDLEDNAVTALVVQRVHRLCRPAPGSTRPLIAAFRDTTDIETLMKAGRNKQTNTNFRSA